MNKFDDQLEQPKVLNQNSQGEEILQEKKGVEFCINEGSNISKFKDVEALARAYDNLQSDYTKKCQTLSNLQKEMEDNKSKILPEVEVVKNWQGEVKKFLDENPQASEYQEQIAKIIMEDDEISKSENPINLAWIKFATKNFLSKKALVKDETFLKEFVFNDENIRNIIINDYFKRVNINETPILISNQRGSKTVMTPSNKPKTIKDASILVEDMFD